MSHLSLRFLSDSHLCHQAERISDLLRAKLEEMSKIKPLYAKLQQVSVCPPSPMMPL